MEFLKSNYNDRVIEEVYFGETKDIQELLTILHEFRQKYINKKNFAMIFPGSNSDPKLMELSEKLEDMFGFYAVDLNIINADYMNAITYPVIYTVGCKPEDHIISTNNGFKFDDKLKLVTQISYTSNVILNKDFTDREVLAILLHEVGHSFVTVQKEMVPLVAAQRDCIVIQCIILAILNLAMLNPAGAYNSLKQLVSNFSFIKKFRADIDKNIRKSPIGRIWDKIYVGTFGRLSMMINKGFNFLANITGLNSLSKALTVFLNGWFFLGNKGKKNVEKQYKTTNAFGRSMEYFSDNLPASYGLGMDLASALRKMEFKDASQSEKVLNKIYNLNPINLVLGEMAKLPYYEMINSMDVHPKFANRVNKIEADLKRELSKSKMNPKMKQEIENSLKEINKLKTEFKKCENIKNSDPNAYKQLWMKAFMDETEDQFLTSDEKAYTSMKDRDEYFEKMLKEHSELFESDIDLYEFE